MTSRAGWLAALLLPALYLLPSGYCAAGDPEPYTRVVTLAPNLTELVFAAGAGDTLVGVSAYSDFPGEAASLPVIGDAFSLDRERLALLDPDALFAWEDGTPSHVVDELRQAGFNVEVLRTSRLDDIATALLQIGRLTGHSASATAAASDFRHRLRALREEFTDVGIVSVFYQVSSRPLYTVSGSHYVSELITLCGGSNIFRDLDALAPAVSVEAVVARDPEVMLAAGDAGSDAFEQWQRWPGIAANRYGNHFLVPADEIGRATPRVLAAGRAMCRALESARARRDGDRSD